MHIAYYMQNAYKCIGVALESSAFLHPYDAITVAMNPRLLLPSHRMLAEMLFNVHLQRYLTINAYFTRWLIRTNSYECTIFPNPSNG